MPCWSWWQPSCSCTPRACRRVRAAVPMRRVAGARGLIWHGLLHPLCLPPAEGSRAASGCMQRGWHAGGASCAMLRGVGQRGWAAGVASCAFATPSFRAPSPIAGRAVALNTPAPLPCRAPRAAASAHRYGSSKASGKARELEGCLGVLLVDFLRLYGRALNNMEVCVVLCLCLCVGCGGVVVVVGKGGGQGVSCRKVGVSCCMGWLRGRGHWAGESGKRAPCWFSALPFTICQAQSARFRPWPGPLAERWKLWQACRVRTGGEV